MPNSTTNHTLSHKNYIDNATTSVLKVEAIPLALYIHIPWCVKKCPYCDFNSHKLPAEQTLSLYDDYVDALLADALMQHPLTQGRELSSIFIGGGTPSLLPILHYQRLFDGLKNLYRFADNIEITMEANPGTLEHAPFAEYLEVGINRLSIGVQSFDGDKLKTLGRVHDAQQAVIAIKAAKNAGFERVNVDLMHGLPQQTLTEAIYDIQTAHNAGATHISWYQLTIEPNTVFFRNQPVLPDEDSLADIEQAGQALLQRLGYKNYEVSAWAGMTDSACRHNVNYWQFGDYLAIGAGAHGKVTVDDSQSKSGIDSALLGVSGIYRFSKSRLPKDYIAHLNLSESMISQVGVPKMIGWHSVADDELVCEFMLNALRLYKGVSWQLFESRTGKSYDSIVSVISELVTKGLLVDSTNILQPTLLGQRYLNQILRAFV